MCWYCLVNKSAPTFLLFYKHMTSRYRINLSLSLGTPRSIIFFIIYLSKCVLNPWQNPIKYSFNHLKYGNISDVIQILWKVYAFSQHTYIQVPHPIHYSLTHYVSNFTLPLLTTCSSMFVYQLGLIPWNGPVNLDLFHFFTQNTYNV
jgi:hypothetical protein